MANRPEDKDRKPGKHHLNKTCPGSCPGKRFLAIISKKYTFEIIGIVMQNGASRFNFIVKETQGSPKTIAERLKELCKENILERKSYAEIPPRVEYSLTEKGRDLKPVMKKMLEWNDRWSID